MKINSRREMRWKDVNDIKHKAKQKFHWVIHHPRKALILFIQETSLPSLDWHFLSFSLLIHIHFIFCFFLHLQFSSCYYYKLSLAYWFWWKQQHQEEIGRTEVFYWCISEWAQQFFLKSISMPLVGERKYVLKN